MSPIQSDFPSILLVNVIELLERTKLPAREKMLAAIREVCPDKDLKKAAEVVLSVQLATLVKIQDIASEALTKSPTDSLIAKIYSFLAHRPTQTLSRLFINGTYVSYFILAITSLQTGDASDIERVKDTAKIKNYTLVTQFIDACSPSAAAAEAIAAPRAENIHRHLDVAMTQLKDAREAIDFSSRYVFLSRSMQSLLRNSQGRSEHRVSAGAGAHASAVKSLFPSTTLAPVSNTLTDFTALAREIDASKSPVPRALPTAPPSTDVITPLVVFLNSACFTSVYTKKPHTVEEVLTEITKVSPGKDISRAAAIDPTARLSLLQTLSEKAKVALSRDSGSRKPLTTAVYKVLAEASPAELIAFFSDFVQVNAFIVLAETRANPKAKDPSTVEDDYIGAFKAGHKLSQRLILHSLGKEKLSLPVTKMMTWASSISEMTISGMLSEAIDLLNQLKTDPVVQSPYLFALHLEKGLAAILRIQLIHTLKALHTAEPASVARKTFDARILDFLAAPTSSSWLANDSTPNSLTRSFQNLEALAKIMESLHTMLPAASQEALKPTAKLGDTPADRLLAISAGLADCKAMALGMRDAGAGAAPPTAAAVARLPRGTAAASADFDLEAYL